MKKITDRLHRVRGQVEGIERAIADGKECAEVIPQLLAIKGAVAGVVREYLEASLTTCVDEQDPEKMKEVIKTLIKHT